MNNKNNIQRKEEQEVSRRAKPKATGAGEPNKVSPALSFLLLKCNNCKRTWEYKGKAKYYATCPTCLYKVNIEKSRRKKKHD